LDKFVEIGVREYNVINSEKNANNYRFKPSQVILHKDFDYVRLNHDLAVIKLNEDSIKWDNFTAPICVGDANSSLVGSSATVIGWGRLSEGGDRPEILQKVTVPIINNDQCRTKLNKWFDIHEGQMCAGFTEGLKDACQGDSGGPLIVREKGRYTIVGIVSAGIGCARPQLPGVYSRVSHYLDWIKQQIAS
jgi:secreted trypsin-like serine protease